MGVELRHRTFEAIGHWFLRPLGRQSERSESATWKWNQQSQETSLKLCEISLTNWRKNLSLTKEGKSWKFTFCWHCPSSWQDNSVSSLGICQTAYLSYSCLTDVWPQRRSMCTFQVILLCSMPQVSGRCDLHPMHTTWERSRFRFVEAEAWTASSLFCKRRRF